MIHKYQPAAAVQKPIPSPLSKNRFLGWMQSSLYCKQICSSDPITVFGCMSSVTKNHLILMIPKTMKS